MMYAAGPVCELKRTQYYGLPGEEVHSMRGFGVVPAAVVPALKIIPSVIGLIGRLFGAAPRGELQKFQRTLYRYMNGLASESGIPVTCYWFGEQVMVNPDGSYGVVVGKNGDANSTAVKLAQIMAGQAYYITHCTRSDGDCVNHPEDATFELLNPGAVPAADVPYTSPGGTTSTVVTGPVQSAVSPILAGFVPESGIWPWVLGAGILLLFLSPQKRRRRRKA